MSSRNLALALAAGNGVTVLPDVTMPPAVNQVQAVTQVSGGTVQTGFITPPVAGGALPLAGGTMTGPITLAGNGAQPLHAVPLQQVSAAVAAAPFLSLGGGVMTGQITLAGNATVPLHAVPLQQVSSIVSAAPFLPTAGGTMGGALTLAADPATALGAATRQYVDGTIARAGGPFLPTAGGTMGGLLTTLALTVNGVLTASGGYLTAGYNANSVLPPAGNQSAIGYNYQNIGEIDYWNCGSPAATSHIFWQLSSGVATRLMDINNGGRVQAYGGFTSLGGYFIVNYNGNGVIPLAGAQSAQGYNYVGGQGEIDYWNCSGVSSQSHIFWQRTSGGAATRLMDINSTGQVTAYNGFAPMSPTGPNIRSGVGAASGTQPKGSLWMRTDGAVGSTLYVSQGAGTWNAVAGV